jgi:hypothetical protein
MHDLKYPPSLSGWFEVDSVAKLPASSGLRKRYMSKMKQEVSLVS